MTGEAISCLTKAKAAIPANDKEDRSAAIGVLGKAYLAAGDSLQAIQCYNEALKLAPDNARIIKARAEYYLDREEYSLAEADLQKFGRLLPGDPYAWFARGVIALAKDELKEALNASSRAIALDSSYLKAVLLRAIVNCRLSDYNAAADDFIALVSGGDSDSALGILWMFMQGDESKALLISKLKAQGVKDSSTVGWPLLVGIVYMADEQWDKALAQYGAHYEDYPELFYEPIARCYYELGQNEKALAIIDKAIAAAEDDDADMYELKADILTELGRDAEAMALAERAVALAPEDASKYYKLGMMQWFAGDNREALSNFTTAISLQPDVAPLYCYRGVVNRNLGRENEAISDFEKAVRVGTEVAEGDSVAAPDSFVGLALVHLGQTQRAREYIATYEDDADEYYNVACAYALLGDSQKALSYLRKALDDGYCEMRHVEERDPDMASIRRLPEFKSLIEQQRKRIANFRDPIDFDRLANGTSQAAAAEPWNETDDEGRVIASHIPFTKQGGVMMVKCHINDLPLYFVFDTGASDVSMSLVDALFMYKNNYLRSKDIVGAASYSNAQGDVDEGTVVNLREVTFGGLKLTNVRASVVRNQTAPLLLGQSVLSRLGKVEIDNRAHEIVITK